jgi:hypothetical protein
VVVTALAFVVVGVLVAGWDFEKVRFDGQGLQHGSHCGVHPLAGRPGNGGGLLPVPVGLGGQQGRLQGVELRGDGGYEDGNASIRDGRLGVMLIVL